MKPSQCRFWHLADKLDVRYYNSYWAVANVRFAGLSGANDTERTIA